MAEWISVVTATNVPHCIGSAQTPFKQYPDGFDPNFPSGEFGPGYELTYLPVQRPDPPELNDVLERAVQQQTVGDNSVMYPGAYDSGAWVIGWNVEAQDLGVSQTIKRHMLDVSRDIRVDQGFALQNGATLLLPLTEDFNRQLQGSLAWLELAVSQLEVPATHTMTFSGSGGYQVEMGLETLKSAVVAFGAAFYGMRNVYATAINDIALATTPADVDAVTWEF